MRFEISIPGEHRRGRIKQISAPRHRIEEETFKKALRVLASRRIQTHRILEPAVATARVLPLTSGPGARGLRDGQRRPRCRRDRAHEGLAVTRLDEDALLLGRPLPLRRDRGRHPRGQGPPRTSFRATAGSSTGCAGEGRSSCSTSGRSTRRRSPPPIRADERARHRRGSSGPHPRPHGPRLQLSPTASDPQTSRAGCRSGPSPT